MIFRQFLHTHPVAISYLFGCGGHAACAVVDSVGDTAPYLRVADNTSMRIHFVIDSHIHADHRSAWRALAAEAGRGEAMACHSVGNLNRASRRSRRAAAGQRARRSVRTTANTILFSRPALDLGDAPR